MHPDCKKVLVSDKQIIARSEELGREISEYYKDSNPIAIGLLKGSVPFLAELVKNIDVDIEMDFMDVSSYSGVNSTEVKIIKDVETPIKDRRILIVEDIVDTGKTLKEVKELLLSRGVADVKIVTLLNKPEGRMVDIEPDWTAFVIPNEFVIGYGLDFNQKYRNLPYVGVLKEECYM